MPASGLISKASNDGEVWGESARSLAPEPIMKRTTVLLTDDHAIVVEGLRSILEPGFDVVGVAVDGLELVKAAEKLRPDVIVADVSMPFLNGIEATRQIRAANHQTKVVFLSMHSDMVYVSEAFQAGGSAYVLKSSAGVEIVTAIREALQGGTFVTSPSKKAHWQHKSNATKVLRRCCTAYPHGGAKCCR